MMRMLSLTLGCLSSVLALAGAGPVRAETFPSRPMTMVVPFSAGGPTDLVARVVGERMSQILGQQIIIENLGGAGGMSGANRVARATPDGYSMVMGTVGTHAQNQTLYARPLYNAVDDFAPVALIAEVPLVLVVRNDLPVTDLQSFMTYARANQKAMNFASSGAGAAVHLGTLTLNAAIGIETTHVAFRGSSPAMTEVIGGRIDYMTDVISVVIPQVQGKALKAIAILHSQRSPALPDVKTADEQGLKGFTAYTWNAIFLPKGAPPEIIATLNKAAREAMAAPDVKKRLEELGYALASPERATPAYLGQFVKDEIVKWAEPIRKSGVRVE